MWWCRAAWVLVAMHRGVEVRRVAAQHQARAHASCSQGGNDGDDDNDAKRDSRVQIKVYLRPVMMEEC